jgi:carbonic anhydrase
MDARLDPARFMGLKEGDAHVIRNAGGRASDDAIRSLIISHEMMGTDQWLIVHHTECGMENMDEQTMNERMTEKYDAGAIDVDWLSIADPRAGVVEDVEKIRTHPLVSEKVTVYGFLFHMSTGLLEQIV